MAADDGDLVDHRVRIGAFLDRFGRERNLTLPPLDDQGVGQVQRGSAVVSIHVLADKNILLLLSRVAKQPTLDEAKAKRLLAASFIETGDAAFALHPETSDLYLRILRGLDGLDYEEFEDILHSIAQAADHWDDKLSAL